MDWWIYDPSGNTLWHVDDGGTSVVGMMKPIASFAHHRTVLTDESVPWYRAEAFANLLFEA